MSFKVWHISDTHGSHELLRVPDVDILIFSGDCSNYHDVARNHPEVLKFIEWIEFLPIKHKIWIAGNHDTSIYNRAVSPKELCKTSIYLENEEVEIGGLKIWGSPYTPTFGEWAFMRKRGKLAPLWETIPGDLNFLITHGPPKAILDLTINPDNTLEQVGDKELYNEVMLKKPTFHLFGHVHNCKGVINQGIFEHEGITFSNGSVVTDGKMGKLSSNGNIIDIDF